MNKSIFFFGQDVTGPQKHLWIKTKQSNSISEIQKFLEVNTGSKYENEAKILIDSLQLNIALLSNNIDTIQRFINFSQNAKNLEIAKSTIDTLKKLILILLKFEYKYVFSMPEGGVTSGAASGVWDPALQIFDPPVLAAGSFKSIKYKDIPIELLDNNIEQGMIKTKEFGDFIVLLHGYRLDDLRSAISFITTKMNI
jgi:hypothetical protein